MPATTRTASLLARTCSSCLIRRSAAFSVAIIATVLLLACGIVSGKPSTSAPGGINDPDELWDACNERFSEIDDWARTKSEELDDDFFQGRKDFLDAATEQKQVLEDAGRMRSELDANCAEKADELRQAATNSDEERRSSRNCDDCLSIRQLNEDYEANSFATDQAYWGTRHNFGGTVESVDQEPSVPPKPLVRVRSDGARITFRFGWDDDYSWALDVRKGDWVKANCRITRVGTSWSSGNTVIPFLDECVKAD